MCEVQLQLQRIGTVIRALQAEIYHLVFIVRLYFYCKSGSRHIIGLKNAVRNVGVVQGLHWFIKQNHHFTHVVDAGYFRIHWVLNNYNLVLTDQIHFEVRITTIACKFELEILSVLPISSLKMTKICTLL
jgi:hypothetical protein